MDEALSREKAFFRKQESCLLRFPFEAVPGVHLS
jgi:hypothetical protein